MNHKTQSEVEQDLRDQTKQSKWEQNRHRTGYKHQREQEKQCILIMYVWPRKQHKTTFSAQEIWGLH